MSQRFSTTLSSLQGFGALARDLPNHAPHQSAMRAAAKRIRDMFELPSQPSEEELLRALRLFEAWCTQAGPPPTETDWALAPWVCLQGSPRLLSYSQVSEGLSKRLREERQPRHLRALIYSYLRDYGASDREVAAAGEMITVSLMRHRSAWAERWRDRTAGVRLFAAGGLPDRLAEAALAAGGGVTSLLRELGFTSELVTHSGLHEPIADAVLVQLATKLREEPMYSADTVGQALAFLRSGNQLRFPAQRVATAEALLAPFANKDLRNLPARAVLMQFFDELYGDPRSHRKNWVGVSEAARKTITRWLARKALDLFFDILSDTADPIWKWRRAFWLAFERHGAIDDAWPVFGVAAREYIARKDLKSKVVGNGTLRHGMRDQSVMIMRMGNLVVAEWSHSGSTRIWLEDDDRAPALGAPSYFASELRADCLYDQRHDGTHWYAWQQELAAWLATRLGVRVGVAEMKPNG